MPLIRLSAQLYNTLYEYALTQEKVAELTVEDPSEAFEDLRDRCDLVRLKDRLKDSPEMAQGAPVDRKWLEKVRTEGKYATVSIRWLGRRFRKEGQGLTSSRG